MRNSNHQVRALRAALLFSLCLLPMRAAHAVVVDVRPYAPLGTLLNTAPAPFPGSHPHICPTGVTCGAPNADTTGINSLTSPVPSPVTWDGEGTSSVTLSGTTVVVNLVLTNSHYRVFQPLSDGIVATVEETIMLPNATYNLMANATVNGQYLLEPGDFFSHDHAVNLVGGSLNVLGGSGGFNSSTPNTVSGTPDPYSFFTNYSASNLSGPLTFQYEHGMLIEKMSPAAAGHAEINLPSSAHLTIELFPRADLNHDNIVNAADIDNMNACILAGCVEPAWDFDGDGAVSSSDRDIWFSEAAAILLGPGREFLPGDANLDAVVDAQDYIAWNDHKYTNESALSKGDFNYDGVVDGADFILWNAHKFTSSDTVSVPEPHSLMIVGLLASLPWISRRRRLG